MDLTGIRELYVPSPPSAAHALLVSAIDYVHILPLTRRVATTPLPYYTGSRCPVAAVTTARKFGSVTTLVQKHIQRSIIESAKLDVPLLPYFQAVRLFSDVIYMRAL